MNFNKPRPEEPEINLIPFIDVLLVILIFLMLSTTYSKFTELQVALPVADAEQARDRLRDQTHTAAGLTPLRFTHEQVRYEPEHVLAILAQTASRFAISTK